MGGYGALKWALREPDRFAAAASMSAAADVAGMQAQGDWRRLPGIHPAVAALQSAGN